MNSDVEYVFRQDPNFYYYTGFTESHSIIVLEKRGNETKFTLFVQPKDPKMEIWTGTICGVNGAVSNFGAEQAFINKELDSYVTSQILNYKNLYYHCPDKNSSEHNFVHQIEDNYDLKLVNL
jgi:Xaa-Pro aminopeptidase